jgi:excisionase family DNA binding protein
MELQPLHPNRHERRAAPKRLAVTIVDACEITGLGRTKIYELIGQGKLKAVSIGRRRLVLMESIEALLLPDAA